MRAFVILLAFLLPIVASAQKDLFMQEFNEVNNWFFNQQEVVLMQKYIYYKDSLMAVPVDTSVCKIIKNNSAIHYKVKGVESFCDSGYMVKISHTAKYMTVSKIEKTDTAQLRAIFNEGFSSFNVFTKTGLSQNNSTWELTEGTMGVNSASIIMDRKAHKIKSLKIFMAGNHPLISPYSKADEAKSTVLINIEYEYQAKIKKEDIETLSDFISIDEGHITASQKYKEYRLKLVSEKQ